MFRLPLIKLGNIYCLLIVAFAWMVIFTDQAAAQSCGSQSSGGYTPCDVNDCRELNENGSNSRCPFDASSGSPVNVDSCGDRDASGRTIREWQVTSRIVSCIEGAVVMAIYTALDNLSVYLNLFKILALLAVVWYGIQVFSGEPKIKQMTFTLMLKIGFVAWFLFNIQFFATVPLAITRWMSELVMGGWSPWYQMDLYIGKVMGFGPNTDFNNGLFSLIGGAIFSAFGGGLVTLIGALSALTTLYFGFRAIFTYLGAVILIAFVMIISPFLVPLILFQYTQRYFKRWTDLLFAAMLNPVLLFAFLSIFMGLMNATVDSLVQNVIGTNDFKPIWRADSTPFSWTLPNDPLVIKELDKTLLPQTQNLPVHGTFSTATLGQVQEVNPITQFVLDFGPDHAAKMQRLAYVFLGLFLLILIVTSLMNEIPNISDSIAGIVTGLSFQGMPLLSEIKGLIARMKSVGG